MLLNTRGTASIVFLVRGEIFGSLFLPRLLTSSGYGIFDEIFVSTFRRMSKDREQEVFNEKYSLKMSFFFVKLIEQCNVNVKVSFLLHVESEPAAVMTDCSTQSSIQLLKVLLKFRGRRGWGRGGGGGSGAKNPFHHLVFLTSPW